MNLTLVMNKISFFLLLIFLSCTYRTFCKPVNLKDKNNSPVNSVILKGFVKSAYFDEQILSFNYEPEITIEINAPGNNVFDPSKKVLLIFYALPNMNSIDETIGRKKEPGLDWHYDIQHIGAQTRFLRNKINDYNIVVAYMATKEESWPWWMMKHPGGNLIIRHVADTVKNIFKSFKTDIAFCSHSGGGSFVLGYINSISIIPNEVKRISFLDSEYYYADSLKQGTKLINWLNAKKDHYLCAIAYDDRDVVIDGKNIGTLNGGTFFRTTLMKDRLEKDFSFKDESDSLFTKFTSLNGRIKFFLKKNPDHLMWHTLLVEKNGFIESILTGTTYEGEGYQFWGSRAYTQFIQP